MALQGMRLGSIRSCRIRRCAVFYGGVAGPSTLASSYHLDEKHTSNGQFAANHFAALPCCLCGGQTYRGCSATDFVFEGPMRLEPALPPLLATGLDRMGITLAPVPHKWNGFIGGLCASRTRDDEKAQLSRGRRLPVPLN